MPIREIFENLIANNQSQPLLELIQEVKNSIPKRQRIGKGIVWTLREIRSSTIKSTKVLEHFNRQ